ncbi:hypothetical protein ACJMK2_038110 [Sinanodonta woodiana]|uniref:Peptidase M12B domain-containing protein n=1 Tax=Sinanodonta woodiana TaxID=1069815 RepID=A0ABD3WQY2_SINWO
MVWLTDVTRRLPTVKRDSSDPSLPDNLTFQLRGGSRSLTLNLKRNHQINPNADMYFVRKSNDGQSHLEKALNLENEDVAYYQDWQNGAFMTVRCVRRSNGQCNRVINGNVQIEERNYDLQPANTDITLEDLTDIPDIGSLYVLRDQNIVHREMMVTDEGTVNEANKEQEVKRVLRGNPSRRKPHRVPNSMTCSRKKPRLSARNNQRQVYYVEVAVLIDSGVWDFYSSLMQTNRGPVPPARVLIKLRQVFSHIINGVDLRYRGIKDPTIKISVTLREFYIFQKQKDFPHLESWVEAVPGTDWIDVNNYIKDLSNWTSINGHLSDHVMLFTKYNIYTDDDPEERMNGYSYTRSVCDDCHKASIIKTRDYMFTVLTAAHELGHNLGADHDGEKEGAACRADDFFLMSPDDPVFRENKPYSRNPWIFSNCSVESFKRALPDKTCLFNVGQYYDEDEWSTFMLVQPGEVFSNNAQCEFAHGHGSTFCGVCTLCVNVFV